MVSVMPMRRPSIKRLSVTPMWKQAADWIQAAVNSGELRPGEKLPAMRDLAYDWGVGYGLMQRVLQELKDRGTLVSQSGKGVYVAGEPEEEGEGTEGT